MKLLLPFAALLLLVAPSRDSVTLTFAPEEDTVFLRTFEAEAEYHLADLAASIDGEALERPDELPDYEMSFHELIAVTDTLRAVSDGRPTELLRTFDELSQENVDSQDGEDFESVYASALTGRTVRFEWDEGEELYFAEAADDGDELDEEVAEWLAEDMDLRLLLPEGEVEPGDEWEIDARLYLAFMWPSGLLGFYPEDGDPEDGERSLSGQTIENLEGSGTARLEEIREEDGVLIAVLHVELEITTFTEHVVPAFDGDDERYPHPEITVEVEIERSIEGTILWDVENGHALLAELEGDASRLHTETSTLTGEHEGEEISAELEQSRLLEGTVRYRATIERQ